jgi:hypothetical protein
MSVGESIIGAQKLVDAVGAWPDFHDALVLWVKLDSGQPRNEQPSVDALLYTLGTAFDVGPDGSLILKDFYLVHLRFTSVTELQISGFNEQNAILELKIDEAGEQFWVDFVGCTGLDAQFLCNAIEVVSVTPCAVDGKPNTLPTS